MVSVVTTRSGVLGTGSFLGFGGHSPPELFQVGIAISPMLLP